MPPAPLDEGAVGIGMPPAPLDEGAVGIGMPPAPLVENLQALQIKGLRVQALFE